ncbi:MAG: DUF742 domain-containing protein [Catenulispora sp.]|nr:DUF742 domain-containing protein [Catenulispora sp.]
MRGEGGARHEWFDGEAGPLVRSFAITGGRAREGAEFELLSYVVAQPVDEQRLALHLQPEHRAILSRARDPVSVAELASHVGLSLAVVRVLLADLAEAGAISMIAAQTPAHQVPDDDILQAVIHGLRSS